MYDTEDAVGGQQRLSAKRGISATMYPFCDPWDPFLAAPPFSMSYPPNLAQVTQQKFIERSEGKS